jgi:hypothetical protein
MDIISFDTGDFDRLSRQLAQAKENNMHTASPRITYKMSPLQRVGLRAD